MTNLILFFKTNQEREFKLVIKNVKDDIDNNYIKDLMYLITDNNIVDFNLKTLEFVSPKSFEFKCSSESEFTF